MKIKYQVQKIALFIISMAFMIVVDLYFSNVVYRTYEPVVKGILGITLLILVYLYILPKHIEKEPIQILFTSTGLKFLIAATFWAIVGYWALRQTIDMVLYLIKLSKNI